MRPPGRSSLQRTFSNSSITVKSNGRIVGDSDNAAVTTARRKGTSRSRGSWVTWLLVLLGLFFLGTFVVLSTVKHYFGTHEIDFITLEEIQQFRRAEHLLYDPTLSTEELEAEQERTGIAREKIPRIIHATWKNDTLPERWQTVREGCQAMLPDFEFKLWTDAGGREFIATMYPDFLSTWDSYPYTIQRADAIRYFVLHRYGGIYMDLDIGCRAHPGPLLHYDAILPVTKPVGVSNDLMFSAPGTAFMTLVVNSLGSFNHAWLFMNYPTVMFSTGPMFISAMYSSWSRTIQGSGRKTATEKGQGRVRILPKSLYGKNAKAEDVPESFYWHYYGSSWHAKDAGFIGFLGKYGYTLLVLGTSIVAIGFCYILWIKRHFILQSPRPGPKYLLEPFELRVPSQPSNETTRETLADTVKSALSEIKETLFKPAKTLLPDNPYFPVSTQADPDSDGISLHSIHQQQDGAHDRNASAFPPADLSSQSPRSYSQATFQHPVTKKPHARQRSRDVEKCSPNRSKSADNGRGSAGSNWLWGTNNVLATPSTTRSGRPLRATMSPEIICEEPSSATSFDTAYFNTQSTSDLHASFLPNQNLSLLSPPTFTSNSNENSTPGNSNGRTGPRPKLSRNHSRKLSDVDDSEQLDVLADLEPVGSATSTRQAGTPISEYPLSTTTRKRALSANGGQTGSIAGAPRIGSPNLTLDG